MIRRRSRPNPFHPELRAIATVLPRTLVTPLTVKWFQLLPTPRVAAKGREISVVKLPSGVCVRVHHGQSRAPDRGPAVLWIHGGGYVLGSAEMDDKWCAQLAGALGVTVAAVDYRLAPEHPFPTPLLDCYDALLWLAGQSRVDPRRVAVAGASAGGGLAAALAQLAHDRGEIDVVGQVLVYPMLDDRSGHVPDPGERNRRLWNNASSRLGWEAYLSDANPKTAVPARRENLSGLPATWIGVGTLDVLHDEAVEYAERLRAAQVPCDLDVVPGAFHGFDVVAAKTAVAQSFRAEMLSFLRRTLAF